MSIEHPELTDAHVIRAYERLVKYYQKIKQGIYNQEVTLEGLPGIVFDEVFEIIEWRRIK